MNTKEKVARKIKDMMVYVDFLKEHRVDEEELSNNYLLKSAIERNLQLAIESALDIGEVIIASEDLQKPENYRSIILNLGREDIIPYDFAERFSNAAKLRNILVHMYTEVDPAVVSQVLQNNLQDFERYVQYIAHYLDKKK
ncbi:MAG: type VII toxin-antitoxin system HepT family RNase toxin [Methanomicrobiales archaeon]